MFILLASEALSAVIRECFNNGIHRIYAECDPRNICSWKLLEKVGMEREAFFHKNIYLYKDENGNPIWKDTYVYAILSITEGFHTVSIVCHGS